MSRHQYPGEYSPTFEITHPLHGCDELVSFDRIIEDEFTAGDAAIHVIAGSGDEKAGMSRHGISPMRGRDDFILPNPADNATMRRVAPIQQCEGWHPSHPSHPSIRGTHPAAAGVGADSLLEASGGEATC